jgi:hypothetical protein
MPEKLIPAWTPTVVMFGVAAMGTYRFASRRISSQVFLQHYGHASNL